MPELPEVEATVRYVAERLIGQRIETVEVLWPRTIANTSPSTFEKSLVGGTFTRAFRRGKFIGLEVSRNGGVPWYLYTHLRMSGSLDVISSSIEYDKHDRVIVVLDNKKSLRFNDPRKFGRMYLHPNQEEISKRLGLEPLGPDFTDSALDQLLASRKTRIKSFLLDQRFIAGLGNIYVDEALFHAGIHPTTPCNRVGEIKTKLLHSGVQEILTDAISLLGTDFGDGVVEGGMYRPKVYGQDGTPCPKCSTTLRKTVVGQRGTHYCPRCQRQQRTRRG